MGYRAVQPLLDACKANLASLVFRRLDYTHLPALRRTSPSRALQLTIGQGQTWGTRWESIVVNCFIPVITARLTLPRSGWHEFG